SSRQGQEPKITLPRIARVRASPASAQHCREPEPCHKAPPAAFVRPSMYGRPRNCRALTARRSRQRNPWRFCLQKGGWRAACLSQERKPKVDRKGGTPDEMVSNLSDSFCRRSGVEQILVERSFVDPCHVATAAEHRPMTSGAGKLPSCRKCHHGEKSHSSNGCGCGCAVFLSPYEPPVFNGLMAADAIRKRLECSAQPDGAGHARDNCSSS